MFQWSASSAIHWAVFASIEGCRSHSAGDHSAHAHNSAWTAMGLAFAAVHAFMSHSTYSPIVSTVSSMPTWEETPLEGFWKNPPNSWLAAAPRAVCTTTSLGIAPPRLG